MSQIFDEQQNIISVVVVTTSLLFTQAPINRQRLTMQLQYSSYAYGWLVDWSMLVNVNVILTTCIFLCHRHDINRHRQGLTMQNYSKLQVQCGTKATAPLLLMVTTGKSQSSKIDWSILDDTNLKYFKMSMSYSPPACSSLFSMSCFKSWIFAGNFRPVHSYPRVLSSTSTCNFTDPVLVGDPTIEHGGVFTNCNKVIDGFLPRAHFLDQE